MVQHLFLGVGDMTKFAKEISLFLAGILFFLSKIMYIRS